MLNMKTVAQSRINKRKKGFTLTEVAIVLGIIGLILGAIWVAAAGVYNNQRVNHGITAILQTAQGVRTLYATSSTVGTAATATDITAGLVQSGSVPSDLINGTALTGPYPGGKTAVTSTADNAGFIIGMSGLTQANCIATLVGIGGSSRDPGLFEAAANQTAIPAAGTAMASPMTNALSTPALSTSVTPTLAVGAYASGIGGCTAATGNTIYAGFSLH